MVVLSVLIGRPSRFVLSRPPASLDRLLFVLLVLTAASASSFVLRPKSVPAVAVVVPSSSSSSSTNRQRNTMPSSLRTAVSSSSSSSSSRNTTKETTDWTIEDPAQAEYARTQLGIWPLDEYNVQLLNEVHPQQYMEEEEEDTKTATAKHSSAAADDDAADDAAAEHQYYDVIAVGSGAGGLVSSKQSGRRGARSALISEKLAGGDCLNVGCIPSKSLLAAAKLVATLRKVVRQETDEDPGTTNFGISVVAGSASTSSHSTTATAAEQQQQPPLPQIVVDFGQVMTRLRQNRARIAPADGHTGTEQTGARVYQGRGHLRGPNTLEVVYPHPPKPAAAVTHKKTILHFKYCVLAMGGRPSLPTNIPGLREAPYTTNEQLFNLQILPPRMIIIGAGVIALEMAQSFALLGSDVTVINRSSTLFQSKFGDTDAAQILQQQLEKDGVKFLSNARIEKVETVHRGEEGGREGKANGTTEKDKTKALPLMTVSINTVVNHTTSEDIVQLDCECLLVATGRTANVENCGLDAGNVTYELGKGVQVNDYGQSVSNPAVYAVGDCVANVPRLTHMAGEMAKLVVQNSLADDDWKLSSLIVPAVMYTSPEYATVGLASQAAADHAGIPDCDVYETRLERNDRGITDGTNIGFCKILVQKDTDTIVGATIVSDRAGEMINEISLAMKNKLGLYAIGRNIHAYPSLGEAVMGCGVQYINKHLPRFD